VIVVPLVEVMANCYGPGVAIGVNADRVDRKFCERIKIVCACVLHREIVGEQKYKVCARQPCLARKKREERERRERKREESSERKRETRLVTWARPKRRSFHFFV
jgi:hypothetical protein